MGPMTGRGAGYCAGYGAPGWTGPLPRRGFGTGWGRGGRGGRGGGWRHRNWYHATGLPGWARYGTGPAYSAPPAWDYGPTVAAPSREEETRYLRQQAEWLKQQLDAIGQRIEELGQEE